MRIRHSLGLVIVHLFLAASPPSRAATIVVDTLLDAGVVDGFCSLREAILAADSNSPSGDCPAGSGPSDRIRFAVTGTILLTSDLPAIGEALAIEGPGRDLLTLDGDNLFPILRFDALSTTQFVVRDLSLAHGFASVFPFESGGCIQTAFSSVGLALLDVTIRDCRATGNGGGIHSGGSLLLDRVWLDGNDAQATGGGGGGLLALGIGNVEIVNSTFSGNFASGSNASGGAMKVYVSGQVEVTSSTFSRNFSNERGGAIHFSGIGSNVLVATLRDSTFVGNESDVDESSSAATGGTLYLSNQTTSQLSLTLSNTVLAMGKDNASPTRCPEILLAPGDAPPELTSAGFNLVADGSCVAAAFPASPGPGLPNLQGDFVGTLASPIDPRLDILGENGGSTPTHLPLQETPHPVVDQGSCPESGQDQRGLRGAASSHRFHDVAAVPDNPAGDGCDIGAVERGASAPTRNLFLDGFESESTLFWSADLP